MEQSQTGAVLIDGKATAQEVQEQVKTQVLGLAAQGRRPPSLALVLVGDDPASQTYVRNKARVSQRLGIASRDLRFPPDLAPEALLEEIEKLNADPLVDGILVQLPLPGALASLETTVVAAVDPTKDVDGFHPENVGRLTLGAPRFVPCTPLGIMQLLHRYRIFLTGKHAVVIGRSNIVGKPVASLLLQQHATVTLCHSRSRDLEAIVRTADLVVAAVGRPRMIKGEWLKEGAVVVDVGINRIDDKLVGDVDFDAALSRASYITPVPGGVGPMTVAMLMANTLQARLSHPD